MHIRFFILSARERMPTGAGCGARRHSAHGHRRSARRGAKAVMVRARRCWVGECARRGACARACARARARLRVRRGRRQSAECGGACTAAERTRTCPRAGRAWLPLEGGTEFESLDAEQGVLARRRIEGDNDETWGEFPDSLSLSLTRAAGAPAALKSLLTGARTPALRARLLGSAGGLWGAKHACGGRNAREHG